MEPPQYIETVQPEICDVELNLVGGVESSDSIKRAWDLMDDQDSRSLLSRIIFFDDFVL